MLVAIDDDDVVEKTETIEIRLERTDNLSNRIRLNVSSGEIEVEDDNDRTCRVIYTGLLCIYTYQCIFKHAFARAHFYIQSCIHKDR